MLSVKSMKGKTKAFSIIVLVPFLLFGFILGTNLIAEQTSGEGGSEIPFEILSPEDAEAYLNQPKAAPAGLIDPETIEDFESSIPVALRYDLNTRIPILGESTYTDPDTGQSIEAATDELLIQLADEQPIESIFEISDDYNLEIIRRFSSRYPSFRIRINPDSDLEEVWRELEGDSRIKIVEPNFILNLD